MEDSTPHVSSRVNGRIKKPKTPYDPSAVTKRREISRQTERCLSIKKITAPAEENVCFHCKKAEKPGVLIRCKQDCEISVHLACLPSTREHFGKDDELTWKCSFHSIQIEKLSPANDANLPKNTRGFTQTRSKPVGKFLGVGADEAREVKNDSSTNVESKNVESGLAGQQSSPTSIEKYSSLSTGNRHDDTTIPDGREWSVKQVFEYFHGKFPQHARVFKRKEIDGPSLYVLKRCDVVKAFHLKLGPAVKIYGEILKMQTNNPDPRLSSIPDGKEWSVKQVFEYFHGKFPEQAYVFKRAEIDGPSLYQLTRSDVVNGLNLKLGPAVKTYGEILKLRTKILGPRLSW